MKQLIFLLPLFCFYSLMGQKANYKQAERFSRNRVENLVGSTNVSPKFFKDSDRFWFAYYREDGTRYYYVDPKKSEFRELFDREWMARELTQITHKPFNSRDLRIVFTNADKDEKILKFKVDTFQFEYDVFANRLTKLDSLDKSDKEKEKRERPKGQIGIYSPDSTYIVYAKNHNLFVMSVKDSVETQLTTNGELDYSYGYVRDSVDKRVPAMGAFWFNDSKRFYVARRDMRKVKDLFVVNVLGSRPNLNQYKYVMAGDEFVAQVELSIFDAVTHEEIKVDIDKWKDQSFSFINIGLPTDKGKYGLYFMRKKRTCDEVDVCRVDRQSGEVTVLFSEISKPYFNNDFHHISILNEGKDILWWSERTGYGHFYHYDGDGKLLNPISVGNWTAGKMIKIDTIGRTIYFEGYGQKKDEFPYYSRINKANIDRSGVVMLTPEEATHSAMFSKSGRYFVDNYSRADLAPVSVLRDNNGKVIFELAKTNLDRLYETGWKMPEPFTIKAADGITDLYGFMWKPYDFDSTRTYPIISYVYPGPQTEALQLTFNVTGVYNAPLAQLGFIVVTFGHRGGSPMRDKWYHTYGYGNLRDYPLADDKYGLEQLAERYSFIDISKVGIFGHSGGGFMSTAALCTYPDFYTAAVSSSGNHDNNIYNQWWGETHHGVKEIEKTTKKSEKDSITGRDTTYSVKDVRFETKIPSNIELARNLKGYLMLVTGDVDNNVHPGNTIRMADALIKAGKNFDFVVLPGQTHSFGGVHRSFYERKMWYHFAKYLLGDFSSNEYTEIDEYNRLR